MYGTGISREGEILDLAVKLDIINKSGAWFSYNGERLGQGRDNVKVYLQEHPDFANEIDKLIRADAGRLSFARGGKTVAPKKKRLRQLRLSLPLHPHPRPGEERGGEY